MSPVFMPEPTRQSENRDASNRNKGQYRDDFGKRTESGTSDDD